MAENGKKNIKKSFEILYVTQLTIGFSLLANF
jgi:hypothetical protein